MQEKSLSGSLTNYCISIAKSAIVACTIPPSTRFDEGGEMKDSYARRRAAALNCNLHSFRPTRHHTYFRVLSLGEIETIRNFTHIG